VTKSLTGLNKMALAWSGPTLNELRLTVK